MPTEVRDSTPPRPTRSLRQRLDHVMNHLATEVIVALLIVVSVGLLLAEVSIDRSSSAHARVMAANDALTWVFIFELTLRFLGERQKRRFFRRFWLDIIAVLPLFRAFRVLRILRLLRLFRVGVILGNRVGFIRRLLTVVKFEYVFAALAIVVTVLMGAVSIRFAEGKDMQALDTFEEALWYSVMTLAAAEPIGAEPATRFGRMITLTLMLGGMTLFAFFAGTVSAVMIEALRKLRLSPMQLEELENHVVICGWNGAVPLLIRQLCSDPSPPPIIVITDGAELSEAQLEEFMPRVRVIHDDFTRSAVLKSAGIERARYAALFSDAGKESRSQQDRDARSVLAALLIERMNPRIHTIVQLLNRENEVSLREGGVENVIVSDEYVGTTMATLVRNRGALPLLGALLKGGDGTQIRTEPVPRDIIGRSVAEALGVIKSQHDAILLAVRTRGPSGQTLFNPPGEFILEEGHLMIVAGSRGPDSRGPRA